MKLNTEQITEIEKHLDVLPIPDDHPVIEQLEQIFGDHTFYLSSDGLLVWEEVDNENLEDARAVALQVAEWSDEDRSSLVPHEPKATPIVMDLAGGGPSSLS